MIGGQVGAAALVHDADPPDEARCLGKALDHGEVDFPERLDGLLRREGRVGAPRILRGIEEIAAHHRNICSRDLTHRVSRETLAGDRAAYSVECRYPDGKAVLRVGILDSRDGQIAGEIGVQAWDR